MLKVVWYPQPLLLYFVLAVGASWEGFPKQLLAPALCLPEQGGDNRVNALLPGGSGAFASGDSRGLSLQPEPLGIREGSSKVPWLPALQLGLAPSV